MSTVGFIGLGTMGQHMARNVLKAGHSLVFYARRQELVDEFTRAGGKAAASPAEVTRSAEFIISIVTADAQVEEVALGPQGVIHGAAAGKIFIDMSTIGPTTVRRVGDRLRAAGLAMVDAPVSGGPWGAEAGTLAIMAGGEAADFARCKPIFAAMGKHIFHVGPLGSGQIVKLVNQMVGGGIMTLVAEGFVLAKAAGADLNQLVDVMAVSSANSAVLEARGKKFLLADNYTPGFMTELMRKDVKLAGDLARQHHVATPVADAALAQYDAAIGLGLGKKDFAAVVKVCEQAAGVKIAANGKN
jgi:3-hydroxyisobutyrate dehydrogenase-like beta-hydroxyacid dehydrogenase